MVVGNGDEYDMMVGNSDEYDMIVGKSGDVYTYTPSPLPTIIS